MRNGGGGGGGGGEEVKGSRSFEIVPRGTVQIPIRAHGEQREIAGVLALACSLFRKRKTRVV